MYAAEIKGTADYGFWGELKNFRIVAESKESFEDAEAQARTKAFRLYGAIDSDIHTVTSIWREPMYGY